MLTNHHRLTLFFVLSLYLVVSISFGLLNPVAEAPDEIAHMALIRFIGQTGHMPKDYDERAEAGYKSDTPMLYHLLVGKLVSWVDTESAPRLKVNGLSPQRLLASDGLSPFSLIHTWDEQFPFQGIVLSWHLARLISTLLGLGSLLVVYRVGLLLFPRTPELAVAGTATIACVPQFQFLAASVNDDNLLGLLTSLFALWLFKIWKQPFRWQAYVWAGLWIGLAVATKYSPALFVLLLPPVLILAVRQRQLSWRQALTRLFVFAAATAAAASWWFIFVEWHFNEIATLGLWAGMLKPLLGGKSADITMLQIAGILTKGTVGGGLTSAPPLDAWMPWLVESFHSFWLFTRHMGALTNTLLQLILLALVLLTGYAVIRIRRPDTPHPQEPASQLDPVAAGLFVAQIVLLFPFPLVWFWTTHNVNETAQGRHFLIPALPAVGFLLTWAWWQFLPTARRRLFVWTLPVGLLLVSLVSFFGFLLPAFPPPLPVRTTPIDNSELTQPVEHVFDSAIELVGFDIAETNNFGALPITLTWRSLQPVSMDYLVGLHLSDSAGNVAASWIGHPVNGRYPTRVWEQGDVVEDTIWLPTTGLRSGAYSLDLDLCPVDMLDDCLRSSHQLSLTTVMVPDFPAAMPDTELVLPDGAHATAIIWQEGQPTSTSDPFTYRAAIPVTLLNRSGEPLENASLQLVGPDGAARRPLIDRGGSSVFLVDSDWLTGSYGLQIRMPSGAATTSEPLMTVSVRQRQFDVPPMSSTLNANFGDELELLGYDFPERRVQPGGELPITLYWRARQRMQSSYIIFNHLLYSRSLDRWGGRDRVPQDYYSTILWADGEVVIDSYTVPVSPQAPDGVFRLDVGAYTSLDGAIHSLPLVANGHTLDRSSVTIATVKVGGAPPDATVDAVQPQVKRNDNLSNQITLVGYDLRQEISAISVTLYWHCDTWLPVDYTTFVHVRPFDEPNAPPVAQMDRPPVDGTYPTSLWDPGETIADSIQVPLPANLAQGQYQIVVGLYDPSTGQRLAVSPPQSQNKQPPNGEILLQEVSIQP